MSFDPLDFSVIPGFPNDILDIEIWVNAFLGFEKVMMKYLHYTYNIFMIV
jgi:hypothetical protein